MITFEILYNKSSDWGYIIYKDGKYLESQGYLRSKQYAVKCAKKRVELHQKGN